MESGFQHNDQEEIDYMTKASVSIRQLHILCFCCWQGNSLNAILTAATFRQFRDRNKVHASLIVQSQATQCSICSLRERTTDESRFCLGQDDRHLKRVLNCCHDMISQELNDGNNILSLVIHTCTGPLENCFSLAIWKMGLVQTLFLSRTCLKE